MNYGIYLYSNTNNNTITANNVRTGGIGSYNDGIALSLNIIGNNITHNLINTSGTTDNKGISLDTNSYLNNISFNNIQTRGSTLTSLANYGIRVSASSNNTFESNIINNSHGSAIYIDTNFANNNNFTNNTIVSNTSWFDLDIST